MRCAHFQCVCLLQGTPETVPLFLQLITYQYVINASYFGHDPCITPYRNRVLLG